MYVKWSPFYYGETESFLLMKKKTRYWNFVPNKQWMYPSSLNILKFCRFFQKIKEN